MNTTVPNDKVTGNSLSADESNENVNAINSKLDGDGTALDGPIEFNDNNQIGLGDADDYSANKTAYSYITPTWCEANVLYLTDSPYIESSGDIPFPQGGPTTGFYIGGLGESRTGFSTGGYLKVGAIIFSSAPTVTEGAIQAFTDSTTNVNGTTIVGGGTFHVLGYYDGTTWKVIV